MKSEEKSKFFIIIILLCAIAVSIFSSCNSHMQHTSTEIEAAKEWNQMLNNTVLPLSRVIPDGADSKNVATPKSSITFFSYAARTSSSYKIDHAQYGGFTQWKGRAKIGTTQPIEKLAFVVDMDSVFSNYALTTSEVLKEKKDAVLGVEQNNPTVRLKSNQLDIHLVDPHFFDTEIFPHSVFVSTDIQPTATADIYTVKGTLYFRKVEQPLEFDAFIKRNGDTITAHTFLDPQEAKEGLLPATDPNLDKNDRRFIIDLDDYDIRYRGFNAIPINKKVTVFVNLEFSTN